MTARGTFPPRGARSRAPGRTLLEARGHHLTSLALWAVTAWLPAVLPVRLTKLLRPSVPGTEVPQLSEREAAP